MEYNSLHNESEILTKIAAGNERAFHTLVRHYHATVFYHALSFTKSFTDAEEIAQDIFMKIWEGRATLIEVERFKDYLFILGRNQIISAMRKRVMKMGAFPNDLSEEVLLPDQQYETKEIDRLIQLAIEQLTPQQRVVFRLSRVEHLNHEQIAARLNISKHAVNWHMVKALNTLRQYFAQHHKGLFSLLISYWFGR